MKKGLIVCGGWDGHDPEKYAKLVSEFLKSNDFDIRIEKETAAFASDFVHNMDLIIPIFTMAFGFSPKGEIKKEEVSNVAKAVVNGAGLAGFHGGMCDAFRQSIDWQFMTGGQWVNHPGGVIDYTVNITKKDDPIMKGISDFAYTSEQYYMHVDPSNVVLATTTYKGDQIWSLEQSPGSPGKVEFLADWIQDVEMPVVWKRKCGKGKVFYSSLGHKAHEFEVPEMQAILTRGMLWASR